MQERVTLLTFLRMIPTGAGSDIYKGLAGQAQTGEIEPVADRPAFGQWSEENRRIKDGRAGGAIVPFTLRNYPWLHAMYEVIDDLPPGGKLVLRKCAQVGFTEFVINLAFFVIAHGGSVFYALYPSKMLVSDFVHARIDTAISQSPAIAALAGDIDNVGLKSFSGGHLYIRSTHIPKGDPQRAPALTEVPADLAVFDEFDRIPPAAVPLVLDRLKASALKWAVYGSTPTFPGVGIDREYQDTTRHEIQIKCTHCGAWQWLKWESVKGPRLGGRGRVWLQCQECAREIERAGMWYNGRARWKARDEGQRVIGFWISRLADPGADLALLWGESLDQRSHKQQVFFNSDLGRPYEPKGSRLTRENLGSCVNPRRTRFEAVGAWTAMGVDVGKPNYYWIKRRLPGGRERTVAVGEAESWSHLDKIMVQYGVRRAVVDDRPELSADVDFQKRHLGKVWLAQEIDQPDAPLARFKRGEGVVLVERTKGLDKAADKLRLMVDELPTAWEAVPNLLEQMTANIKAQRVKEDGAVSYYYTSGGKPDHYHHAKSFVEIAMAILPPEPGPVSDETPMAGRDRW